MLINRDYYLNQIINSMWDGQTKVITGLRRVGKSVLLFDFSADYWCQKIYQYICLFSIPYLTISQTMIVVIYTEKQSTYHMNCCSIYDLRFHP